MQYFSFLQFGPQHVWKVFVSFHIHARSSCCSRCERRYAIKILGVVEFKNVPHKELVLDAQDRHVIPAMWIHFATLLSFAEWKLHAKHAKVLCLSWLQQLEVFSEVFTRHTHTHTVNESLSRATSQSLSMELLLDLVIGSQETPYFFHTFPSFLPSFPGHSWG